MVVTARGPVEPQALGRVMMHEHLHCDIWDPQTDELIQEERPMSEERRAYLMREAVPYLRECTAHGCHAFVEASFPPTRAWPDFYVAASESAGMHIVLCTGFYREVELGTYFVKTHEQQMWRFAMQGSEDALADMCVREIVEGIHGTRVHAGCIKLGSSQPAMTANEAKAFRAGARAQKLTGVPITTHCT